jgi:hypothetical protein
MVDKNLGRLEQFPFRDIWTSEAREFTQSCKRQN